MTQVEAFWAGQCPTPWGLRGASCMGKLSAAQQMPPHSECHRARQRGLGAGWRLHKHLWVPLVFGASSVLSLMELMELSGGAGASRIYGTTVQLVYLFHKFLSSIDYVPGPAQGQRRVRHDPCPPEACSQKRTGTQALRGKRSHALD